MVKLKIFVPFRIQRIFKALCISCFFLCTCSITFDIILPHVYAHEQISLIFNLCFFFNLFTLDYMYIYIPLFNDLMLNIDYDDFGRNEFSFGNQPGPNGVDREASVLSKLGSSSTAELHPKASPHGETKPASMPPASVMTRLILIMVWRKLIRNPNTYSSLIGLTWSLVSFK